MPQNLKIPLIVLAILGTLGAYFFFQVDWEARAIRKQFQALTELLEKDGPVSTFDALSRSRRLAGFFTNPASIPCQISVPLNIVCEIQGAHCRLGRIPLQHELARHRKDDQGNEPKPKGKQSIPRLQGQLPAGH